MARYEERSLALVVDTTAALERKPALRGTIEAGQFPRELAEDRRSGTLLVTDYASSQLEVVDVRDLRPRPA